MISDCVTKISQVNAYGFNSIASQLVEPQHWQIIFGSEQTVTDFKKKFKLDSSIRTGARVDCREFGVKIIKKIKNRSQ